MSGYKVSRSNVTASYKCSITFWSKQKGGTSRCRLEIALDLSTAVLTQNSFLRGSGNVPFPPHFLGLSRADPSPRLQRQACAAGQTTLSLQAWPRDLSAGGSGRETLSAQAVTLCCQRPLCRTVPLRQESPTPSLPEFTLLRGAQEASGGERQNGAQVQLTDSCAR